MTSDNLRELLARLDDPPTIRQSHPDRADISEVRLYLVDPALSAPDPTSTGLHTFGRDGSG